MKKIVLFFLLGALCQQVSFANRTVTATTAKELPPTALRFLEKNFPNQSIYLVNIEKEGSDIQSYGAVLNNGYYIEFNGEGEWRLIDCHRDAVPNSLVPSLIKSYINQKQDGELVTSVEKNLKQSRVKLISRKLLVFDPEFNFISIDE